MHARGAARTRRNVALRPTEILTDGSFLARIYRPPGELRRTARF